MEKTADNEMVIFSAPEGMRIIRSEIKDDGRTIKIYMEGEKDRIVYKQSDEIKVELENFDENFPVIRASQLSLQDTFMRYKPKTNRQKQFKKLLGKVIKQGVEDFRVSSMDFPVGKTPLWWKEKLQEIFPIKRSSMGTKSQYIAFIGYFIKQLIEEEEFEISKAWQVVCDDDVKVLSSHKFKNEQLSKLITDLVNKSRIVIDDELDEEKFAIAGGDYFTNFSCRLADLDELKTPKVAYYFAVGWLVTKV